MGKPKREQGSKVVPIRRAGELSDDHRKHLRDTSGLSDDTINLAKVYTEPTNDEIRKLLGRDSWKRGGGLVFPYPNERGELVFCRVRPDTPRTRKKSDGSREPIKYEQPVGTGLYPYLTPRTLASGTLADSKEALLLFTEGEKKALLLDQLGYPTIGGPGVWGFHDVAHRHAEDRFRFHALLREHVRIQARTVVIVFDSDMEEKEDVAHAARILAAMALEAGAARVLSARIPATSSGDKQGIDDYFVAAGEQAVRNVIEEAQPIEGASLEDPAPPLTSFRALRDAPIDRRLRMPIGYDVRKDGSLWKKGEDEPKRVERATVLIARELEDLDTGELRVELAHRGPRGWRTHIVERQAIADSRAAINAFAPLGLPIDSTTASKVVEWLRDLEHKNHKRLARVPCATRCGWRRIGDAEIFMLAEPVEPAEVESTGCVFDPRDGRARLVRPIRSSGTEEAHLDALRQAFAADRVAATVICGALAAPLLHPLGAPNFAIHLPGDSSRGKSSMLKIAASVFGNPKSEDWIPSWNSTAVGLEVRASTLCDLPMCIDEAGVVDPRERERALYMLINGTGRTRGSKDGGLRDTHSWRTIILSTGEQPLVGEEAATGAQVRVLQFPVDGFGQLDAGGVDAIRGACEDNHGHVGRTWLETLVDIPDWEPYRADFRRMRKEAQGYIAGAGIRSRQAEYLTLLAWTEALAARVLGLGEPDGATMRAWLDDGDDFRVIRSAADRALDVVQGWRSGMAGAFARLEQDAGGKVSARGVSGAREVFGYIDETAVNVLPGALRRVLAEHGMSDRVVLREWKQRGWLVINDGDRPRRNIRVDGRKIWTVAIRRDVFGEDGFSADTSAYQD